MTDQPAQTKPAPPKNVFCNGCGHFLTCHTRGMILHDRCLIVGCDCKMAVLDFPIPIVERAVDDPIKEVPQKKHRRCMTPYQAVQAHQRSGSQLCFICRRANTEPHHIIPRSEGGLPTNDNIVWLCNPHHDEIEDEPFINPARARDNLFFARECYDPTNDPHYPSAAA